MEKEKIVIEDWLVQLINQYHYRFNCEAKNTYGKYLEFNDFLVEISMLYFKKKGMDKIFWKQYNHYTKNNTIPFYVYIMHDTSNNLYKIGKAVDPFSRLNNFKTANASIELLNYYPGFMADEKILHRNYEKYRVKGEWFKLKQKHLDQINKYFKSKPYYYENTLEKDNES